MHDGSAGLKETDVVGSEAAAGAGDSREDQLAVVETEAGFGVKRSVQVVEMVSALVEGVFQQSGVLVVADVEEGCILAGVLWCDHLKQFWNENASAEATIATQGRLSQELLPRNLACQQC